MKRLITYYSEYEKLNFSSCSTRYEVLPYVVEDSAGNKELRELANLLGFKRQGNVKTLKPLLSRCGVRQSLIITHAVCIGETEDTTRTDKTKITKHYLGFISIKETEWIKTVPDCTGIFTDNHLEHLFNGSCDFNIISPIDLPDTRSLLIESWEAFHYLDLLGYSFKQLLERCECEDTVFDDSVFCCGRCGEWNYTNNGYTYNYRITDDEIIGISCGCLAEHLEANFESHINDTDSPLELNVAETLESENKIKHLERFIGGMVDGRGGWFAGKSCREGHPKSVLKEYQSKYPDKEFIFSHDESGQFQTYFSIWEVL